ncbi:hypothetical protein L195_g062788, partial [Trifolium pratense]
IPLFRDKICHVQVQADGGIKADAMHAGMAEMADLPCAGDGGKEEYAIDQTCFPCLR